MRNEKEQTLILERGTLDAVQVLGSYGVFLLPDISAKLVALKVKRDDDGLEYCQWAWRLRGEPGEVAAAVNRAPMLYKSDGDKMLAAFLEAQGATPV
jgi:hypothetical protein